MKSMTPKQMVAAIAKLRAENARLRTKRANVLGGSKEIDRGGWCSPRAWAQRVGPFDHDPFSNPRSHIVSTTRSMLEDGGNGLLNLDAAGSWRCGTTRVIGCADENTSTWIQPPYEIVLAAIAHYGHTRFCALLRFDPSTEWFRRLYRLTALVCVPRQRIDFEPPPGVKASKNPFPHALYYARESDATPAVLRACVAWRTGNGT